MEQFPVFVKYLLPSFDISPFPIIGAPGGLGVMAVFLIAECGKTLRPKPEQVGPTNCGSRDTKEI